MIYHSISRSKAAEEIVHGGLDLDVGLQVSEDGAVHHTILTMTEQDPTGEVISFFPDEVLVVSGGARGVTAGLYPSDG